jgi:NitT/TauT family transport system permease protein
VTAVRSADTTADEAAPAAVPRSPRRPRRTNTVVRAAAPVVVLGLVLAGWTFTSQVLLTPDNRFLLPPPQDVLRNGLLDPLAREQILPALWSTTQVALVGLGVSIVLGVTLGILMSQARWLEFSLYPYAVLLQTIPILAVVPLLGFWFGYDFRSRVLVCVLVSSFPLITNTLFGLRSVEPGLHDLFTLYHASRWQRLVRLQLPAALPAIITGMKISAGLSVIGAIIADFFFRQGEAGIGRLIDAYRQQLATEKLLSALCLSSLVGLVLFWCFDLLGTWIQRRRTA